MFSKLQKAIAGFTYFVVAIAFLVLVTSKTDVLFGVRSLVVMSGSMVPAIPVGSLIITQKSQSLGGPVVSPVEGSPGVNLYRPGDVIAFTRGSITVTHRITEVVKTFGTVRYKTRGDANNVDDVEAVAPEQIIGREIFWLPEVGKIVVFIKTVPGFILFILVPGILYIFQELLSVKREIEKETEKKLLTKLGVGTI